MRKKIVFSSVGFLILFFLAFGSTETEPKSLTAYKTEDNSSMAWIMTEDWVKERLKSPGSAEFRSWVTAKNHVVKLDGPNYVISSYVDSQNSFGSMIRTKFVATVEQTSNDMWRLKTLEFIQ